MHMDAGLLFAGVSSAGKPPESPPGIKESTPPDEFQKVMEQVEGKSSGEVAEAEPNAQPQNLDSTEKLPEETWVDANVLALLVSTVPAVSLPTSVPSVVENVEVEANVDFPAPDEKLELLPSQGCKVAPAETADVQIALNIVSIESKQSPITTKAVIEAPVEEFTLPVAKAAPLADDLEVVKPTIAAPLTTEPVRSKMEESQAVVEAPSKFEAPKKVGDTAPATKVETEIETEASLAAAPVSGETASGQSGLDKQDSESSSNESEPSTPEVAPVVSAPTSRPVHAEVSKKVENSLGLTSAERKAVVHQLTQKIEQLAVNSVRNEVTVRMEPAELGTVLVQVAKDLNGMTASLSASDDRVRKTLHESRNELAATLTAKAHAPVRVEVIQAESTSMGSSTDAQRQSRQDQPQPQSPKHLDNDTIRKDQPVIRRQRIKTTQLDLEI